MGKNKELVLIIDGNNLTFRASAVVDSDAFLDGVNTGLLWGMLNKRIRESEANGYDAVIPFVTFDVGYRPVENDAKINRYLLDSEYKANRVDDGSDPKKTALEKARREWQSKWEQELLNDGNIVLKYPNTEADDLMAYSSLRMSSDTDDNVDMAIWTMDKDLMQVVRDDTDSRVFIYRRLKGRDIIVDSDEVNREKGVPPTKIRMQLALQGDSADNYDKIRGMGGKRGLKLLNEVRDFEELKQRLPEHREQLEFNWALAGCGADYMSTGATTAADNAIDMMMDKI